jgi:hypothetical protein
MPNAIQLIEIIDGVHVDITPRPYKPEPKPVIPLDERLKTVLRAHDAEFCACGHEIGFGDIAWNNGSTEYGTGYCSVEIQCEGCQREIAHIDSWYPEIYERDELLYVLETDWGKHI